MKKYHKMRRNNKKKSFFFFYLRCFIFSQIKFRMSLWTIYIALEKIPSEEKSNNKVQNAFYSVDITILALLSK
jgi:hypothetical protein